MMDAVAATSIRKARRRHVATRPQLLMRSELDGRTSAAKVFDRIDFRNPVAQRHCDRGTRQ